MTGIDLKYRLQCGMLALVLLCSGCGRAINRSAERRIREALPNLIGPARQYSVHITGSAERTIQGKLADVVVEGDDVELSNGILIDHLRLNLKHVDYDATHKRLRHIDSAHFSASIGQNSLDEFLAGEAPAGETLSNVRVTLLDADRVRIDGRRNVLGLDVPFHLTGPLYVAGATRIEIDPTRLVVVGIPITGLVLSFIKSRFESALDLSSLPFPMVLSDVHVTSGHLTISGSADIPAIIEKASH